MAFNSEILKLPQTSQELKDYFGRTPDPDAFILFTGRGNPGLAKDVTRLLDTNYYEPSVTDFPDGEINTLLQETSRGKEVIIFNTLWHRNIDPAKLIKETVSMSSAARLAAALKVSDAMPYFQGRQDRKDRPRTNISAAETAIELVEAGGAQQLLTMDLHAEQSISSVVYKHIPWDLVYGSRVLVPVLNSLNMEDVTIVPPDIGAIPRGKKYRDLMGAQRMAFAIKQRDLFTGATDTTGLIGEITDNAVVIDDEIAKGGTVEGAATLIKDRNHGRGKVIVAATHGKFVEDENGLTLPQRILQPGNPIDHLIITDTIEQSEDVKNNEKVTIVPTAGIFAIAFMTWMLKGESMGKRLQMDEKRIY